ncbi:uncharacterized protein [Henckelia pumila]|uniref:uncharacterized protein n=1 Tax=Henckelia pumila TaxID=405737 RepID=UPI003C6DB992
MAYNKGPIPILWSKEAQMVVSQLAFIHWLETDKLMTHMDFDQKLIACSSSTSKFVLNDDDYFGGLFMMHDELFAYAEKRVSCGDYDSPRKAAELLVAIHGKLPMFFKVTREHDFWDGLYMILRRKKKNRRAPDAYRWSTAHIHPGRRHLGCQS